MSPKATLVLLYSRPLVRNLLWGLVTVGTLIILVIQGASWQAGRTAIAIRTALESEGAAFEFRSTLPPPIPGEANFCATPVLDGLANDPPDKAKLAALARFDLTTRAGGQPLPQLPASAASGLRAGLDLWSKALARDQSNDALAILSALTDQEPVLAELTAALDRPEARWTPQWSERELPSIIFALTMPHYRESQNLARGLAVRALAETATEDAASAHQAVRIICRLSEASAADPMLIGLLVASSKATMAANGAWTLCDARLGTVENFAQLEKDLARIDLEKAAWHAWRGELAASVSSIDALASSAPAESNWFQNSGSLGTLAFIPRGFLRLNAATLAKLQWTHGLKPLRNGGLGALQRSSSGLEAELSNLQSSPLKRPGSFLAVLALPVTSKAVPSVMHAQTLITHARLACALERFFLTEQRYPASLSELGGLPVTDLWSGAPMRYQQTADGRYRLWSIGPDRVDDGGKRNISPGNTPFRDPSYRGDWVWDFPS